METHTLVHLEISARDPGASGKFYRELFGWKIDESAVADYPQFEPASGPGGGFTKVDGKVIKPGDVIPYVGTTDIGATLQRAERLGGKTLLGKTEIPGIGWYAFFSDPDGNRIGLYTSHHAAS